jgi:Fungal specific transcription factor domain
VFEKTIQNINLSDLMDNVNCTVHHAYLQADRFVFLQTQASKSLKDVLLSYAMSDPALLHSVLAHSAQHLATLTPMKLPQTCSITNRKQLVY